MTCIITTVELCVWLLFLVDSFKVTVAEQIKRLNYETEGLFHCAFLPLCCDNLNWIKRKYHQCGCASPLYFALWVMPSYHGDQVSKPLVGELVSNHQCHPLPGGRAGVLRVDKQSSFPGKQHKMEVNTKTAEGRHFVWTPAGFFSSNIQSPHLLLGCLLRKLHADGRGRWMVGAYCCMLITCQLDT